MQILTCAYRLRSEARQALYEAKYRTARERAAEAENLHHTALGRKLRLIAAVLERVTVQR
jgi:hypothetical protein